GREAAISAAIEAAERGETVAAVGGDGTIGLIAGALRAKDAPLAVIPAGRGNDFARVMGIPADPREAAAVALDGEERVIDVADVEMDDADGGPSECVQGRVPRQPGRADVSGRRDRGRGRPPVHDLRRRRSDRRTAGDGARVAALAARPGPKGLLMLAPALGLARATRAISRRTGKGGTTAPGRV